MPAAVFARGGWRAKPASVTRVPGLCCLNRLAGSRSPSRFWKCFARHCVACCPTSQNVSTSCSSAEPVQVEAGRDHPAIHTDRNTRTTGTAAGPPDRQGPAKPGTPLEAFQDQHGDQRGPHLGFQGVKFRVMPRQRVARGAGTDSPSMPLRRIWQT